MSLVLQSFTGGTMPTAGGTAGAAAGGTTAAGSPAVPFAQTLVQSMGGASTKTSEMPVLGNLASLLQGLLSAVQTTGEETGLQEAAAKENLLEGLVQDLEKLDESISSDPALLAALQSWILQVSALLAGSRNAADTSASSDGIIGSAPALSPLAENPETIRFAVQDELTSLVSRIQQSSAEGKEESAAKGIALLNSFSAIVAEHANPESKSKKNTANITEAPAVSLKQPEALQSSTAGLKDKVAVIPDGSGREAKLTAKLDMVIAGSGIPNAEVAGTEKNSAATPKAAVTLPATVPVEETAPEAGISVEAHEIVTAGQLSLRAGVTAPLKAEVPQVPVHQFAQEMDAFITGKLEIVKKGGVAEATITLFPENLGQVDVKITMQNGNLVAQFMTEHSGAKDMLEQQMNQLRAALQSQGLQVERLEVTQSNPSNQSQWGGQQGQGAPNGGQQQGRRSKERSEDNGDALLAAELNGEFKDWVAETKGNDSTQNGRFSAKA